MAVQDKEPPHRQKLNLSKNYFDSSKTRKKKGVIPGLRRQRQVLCMKFWPWSFLPLPAENPESHLFSLASRKNKWDSR